MRATVGPEGGQLRREAAVGVQRKRRPFEHELVLAADEVEVDQRQAALDYPRHRDALTDRELVALVRRRVGDEQDLATGLEDAFDRVGSPDVLADRHADAHALEGDRAGRGARRKHSLLVEDAIIGEIDLEPHRLDPAVGQKRHGVVQLALLDPGQADKHRRPAVRRLPRQLFAGRAAGLLEGGLQHEVFRRIAGKVEFRRQHEVGAERGGLGARFFQPVAVAGDVADDGRDLRERDDEAIGGGGHWDDLARGGRRGQTAEQPRPDSPSPRFDGGEGWGEGRGRLAALLFSPPLHPNLLPASGEKGHRQRTWRD